MRNVPYFKCYFCHRISGCAIKALDKGMVRCQYGTVLSIWKWVVRVTALSIPTMLVIGLIKFYILPHWVQILVYITGGLLGLILLVGVGAYLHLLHRAFRSSGGIYFWWNDHKRSDEDDDLDMGN